MLSLEKVSTIERRPRKNVEITKWLKLTEKFQALQKPSISAQICSQHPGDQANRMQALLKQLSSLKYLVRQGSSIRGHKEDEGNLNELLKCRSEDVPVIKDWLTHSSYKSYDIINELIQLMAHEVLRILLHE